MPSELIFTVRPDAASPARPISLEEAGFRERAHLQEWVRENPEIIGAGVRIVTFEYDAWWARGGRAADRLDLLGLDEDGRLVVAELKRGPATDTVETQAIKYAAFASRFTPRTLAEKHAAYLSRIGGRAVPDAEALDLLVSHVGGGDLDPDLLKRPRIALVAASFHPRVTASAVWLTEMGVDVSLIEFNAYRTEHDIVLAVSHVWPLPDVEDFTVAPRPDEAREAGARGQRRRETRAVVTLVAGGTLEDGAPLALKTEALPARFRERVAAWIAGDGRRGRAAWRNDDSAPLTWELDGEAWSPTGLAKEIAERATGERPRVVNGPSAWTAEGGETLAEMAGFGRGRAEPRDWSDLHDLLLRVRPGEWTTYGDLATLIGSGPQAVAGHVAGCSGGCEAGYRVLQADGRPSPGFYWTDPDDDRDPAAVLREEGLAFDGEDRADPAARLDAAALRARVGAPAEA